MTKTDSVCIKVGSYVSLILIQLPLPVQKCGESRKPNRSRQSRQSKKIDNRGSLKKQSLGGRKRPNSMGNAASKKTYRDYT